MNALIAATLLSANVSGLALQISSPQRDLLVGEPVMVAVRWKATSEVKNVLIVDPDFHASSLLLAVDDGRGARLYREYPHDMVERTLVSGPLKKGQEEIVNLVFYTGGYVKQPRGEAQDGFVFPAAGKYRVRALYIDGDVITNVASNELEFVVREPSGEDRSILSRLQQEPALVTGERDLAAVSELIQKHPSSPYLRLAKLALLRHKGSELHNERDPDTGDSIFYLGKEGMAVYRSRYYRRLADDILSVDDWGGYDEQALALARQYALGAADKQLEQHVRRQLFARHPQSATVKRIKDLEALPPIEDEDDDASPWSARGVDYKVDAVVTHEGNTWKCLQAHRSQSDWAPPRVPALWVKVVSTSEWSHPVQYAVGTQVTYQGTTYTCTQAHTSQTGWTPSNTPALWSHSRP
jgi:hypothetical protein